MRTLRAKEKYEKLLREKVWHIIALFLQYQSHQFPTHLRVTFLRLFVSIQSVSYWLINVSFYNSKMWKQMYSFRSILNKISSGDFCWRLGRRAPKARVSDWGAESAQWIGCGEGVSPPHWGWAWGRGCVPSLEHFSIFDLKKASFGAIFAVKLNGNWLGHWMVCTDWWVWVLL